MCLCDNSKPVTGNQNYHTYPGPPFQVQVVLVGQKDGIVPGVVHTMHKKIYIMSCQHVATGHRQICTFHFIKLIEAPNIAPSVNSVNNTIILHMCHDCERT